MNKGTSTAINWRGHLAAFMFSFIPYISLTMTDRFPHHSWTIPVHAFASGLIFGFLSPGSGWSVLLAPVSAMVCLVTFLSDACIKTSALKESGDAGLGVVLVTAYVVGVGLQTTVPGSILGAILARLLRFAFSMARSSNSPRNASAFDPKSAKSFVGKSVLIGTTYLDHQDALIERKQSHGTILRIDPLKGFEVKLGDASETRIWLPPDMSSFAEASPGEYRLPATGEVVVNPNLICTLTIKNPAPISGAGNA